MCEVAICEWVSMNGRHFLEVFDCFGHAKKYAALLKKRGTVKCILNGYDARNQEVVGVAHIWSL
jgi:hypothetical protein